jgi:para-aminobenzoate synthetase component 1
MSKTVHLEEVPYSPDSSELFERIADLPGAAFLDSGYPHAISGRYDILTADPVAGELPSLPPLPDETDCRHFFRELGAYHREQYAGIQPASQDIPFCGGILGCLHYDWGNPLHRVEVSGGALDPAGQFQLQAYTWCVIQDHLLGRSVLASLPRLTATQRADLMARVSRPGRRRVAPFGLGAPFRSNLDEAGYRHAFERIQAYIQAGDCYQVNLAQRFSAPCSGDPWSAYRELRAIAAAPFSAYLGGTGADAIMCLSPERFLSLHGHRVETAPIKGTRPRHRDPRADALASRNLRRSEKDRAENLMIVDLLRNDLGRCCVPGSIHVDRLFEIQSYPTVHHMVSTISGELRGDCDAFDLIRDSFPGGSITGAPKRRAMEIIAELEPHARQVYCGSILYISADGRMDSNIAIRTLLCRSGEIHCWGGGGIVADSQWQREYQETYDKVGRFLAALEAGLQA